MKIGIVVPFSWSFWGAVVEHAELQADALEAARCTHLAGVRSLFLDRFAPDELDALAAVWERVLPGSSGAGCGG